MILNAHKPDEELCDPHHEEDGQQKTLKTLQANPHQFADAAVSSRAFNLRRQRLRNRGLGLKVDPSCYVAIGATFQNATRPARCRARQTSHAFAS